MTGGSTIFVEDLLLPRSKVFGIGFHKTSTSSLANALYTLGYHVTGYFNTKFVGDWGAVTRYALELADRYDAAQDMPWPVLYQELDQAFPGSKFILTRRDHDEWVASVVEHFGRRNIPTHTAIYGVPTAADWSQTYLARLRRHEDEVFDYFSDRPGDLLVMNIAEGDDWGVLCPFLGIEVPDRRFPHLNPHTDRGKARVRRAARHSLVKLSRRTRVPIPEPFGYVGAERAFAAVHHHCRRFIALTMLADPHAELADPHGELVCHQLDDRLRVEIGRQDEWVRLVTGEDVGTDTGIRNDNLQQCYGSVATRIRSWASNLWDDPPRPRTADGRTQSAAVRDLVNGGVNAFDELAVIGSSHGTEIRSRAPLRQL